MSWFPSRISNIVHTLVYSLPSPNETSVNITNSTVNGTLANATAIASEEKLKKEALVIPLAFAGGKYGAVLVIVAILLNRIHHVVQRPRPPPPPLPHPPLGWYHDMRRRVSRALTSPKTPSYLRIPGLLALGRAWLLFSVITLQVANLWPQNLVKRLEAAHWSAGPLTPLVAPFAHSLAHTTDLLGSWAGHQEMESVCWSVFLCVCIGLICEALANGLDRARRRDAGASFNLFGFSFLCHFYSSPVTHHYNPPNVTHGRPDVHALFQLWLGLTELTWLQAIELSTKLRRNQLLPTGICGALSLTHFLYVLTTSPLRFPSYSFVTHMLALLLTIVITCTVVLRAFTHLFTLGYIPAPIWVNLLPHEGAIPSAEDDVGVALLKLGTACIEATSYSGLRNELAPIPEPQPFVRLSGAGCDNMGRHKQANGFGGFGGRIDDIQVAELTDPHSESPYYRELRKFYKALGSLTKDTFMMVLLSTPVGRKIYTSAWRAWYARWWYGPRHWKFWRRAAWRGPRRRRYIPEPPSLANWPTSGWSSAVRVRPEVVPEVVEAEHEDQPQYTFDQVLRGEVVIEDDEDEAGDWVDETSDNESETSDTEDDGHGQPEDDHQVALYQDLVQEDGAALQPILLAHLTSGAPLTRRRYNALSKRQTSSDPFAAVAASRRAEVTKVSGGDEWDEERRRACVVCMTQHRDVILWPCRCLLMCNDCRDSLAARLSAKDHVCPNCRTKVEGYSRIYVP